MAPADDNSPGAADSSPEVPRRGLLRSSAVVSIGTLSSRVLGLVRDVVLAGLVGAAANADAFFVAFKIPNFLRRLFAEGAFAQAFVPVLSDTREQGGHAAVQALVDRVAATLGATLLGLTLLAIAAAPIVAMIFAPGFSSQPAKLALTADLIRITFPYLLLISLTGFAGGILNSYGRFAVPAFTPVLLNLSLIGAALLLAPSFAEPAYALAWGVLIAGMAQLLFQLPALHSLGLTPRPHWDLEHNGVRRILALMVPALFGVSVSQINLLLDTVLASLLPTGSVAWLYYSDRLTELPLGVFAIAIATVILPALSAQRAKAAGDAFGATLDWAIRMVLLIAIPATVALAMLAPQILTTLFQYGAFEPGDVAKSTHSLRAYTVGLTAFMLVKVLAPGYYARENMKQPVRIGIIAMVANMILNPLLVFPLMWQFDLGHVGLALATSLSAWLNAALLYRGLYRDQVLRPSHALGWLLPRLLVAVTVMGGVVYGLTPEMDAWFAQDWWWRALWTAGLCGAGLVAYVVVLVVLGVRPGMLRGPQR
ncbi:MAG: murein biosynthesis integral membrane protein MurJ [Halieaceae bacterium]|nr:murein biosynthesis integral membrane protein MurJ [Halieaceae bacterium]